MFGIGLTRPLEGVFATIARQLSQRTKAKSRRGGVLALDTPSGLDSDTGTIVGQGQFKSWITGQQTYFAPIQKYLPKYAPSYTPDPQFRAG